jgi:hypothetical protein
MDAVDDDDENEKMFFTILMPPSPLLDPYTVRKPTSLRDSPIPTPP